MMCVQLEEACGLLLQNLHGVNEDGSKPRFAVQALLHSSARFGPANVRELSVRLSIALGIKPAPCVLSLALCLCVAQ